MIQLTAPYDLILAALLACTVLRIADSVVFRNKLRDFAIEPRTVPGFFGIPVAPFLHANWPHLFANIVPLCVLGSLTAYESPRALTLCAIAGVGSGAMTWLFARPSRHLGASGVAYTFFGYLLAAGYYNRGLILISLGVWLLFGKLLRGVLPQGKNISFEAHLFGFIAGIAVVSYYRKLSKLTMLNQAASWASHHTLRVAEETGALLAALTLCLILAAWSNGRVRR